MIKSIFHFGTKVAAFKKNHGMETFDIIQKILLLFKGGNWVVNKNPCVPFCAIGPDHALERLNRSVKVTGGLVGITLNPSARVKFFLVAPKTWQV